MKRRTVCSMTVLLSFLMIFSCSTNGALKKQQSITARNLGELYMMQGKHIAALQEFIKAEKLDPNDPYLLYDMGLVYMSMEKMELAAGRFKKALEIKPDFGVAKNSLGVLYLIKKDWDTAIDIFNEVLENLLYPTPQFALSNLGDAYFGKKQFDMAEKYYRSALKKEPEYANAWRGLGSTYQATDRMLKAVKAFENAVELAPEWAQLQFDLADAYRLSRDYEKAADAYQKVIEMEPLGELAEKAKERLKSMP